MFGWYVLRIHNILMPEHNNNSQLVVGHRLIVHYHFTGPSLHFPYTSSNNILFFKILLCHQQPILQVLVSTVYTSRLTSLYMFMILPCYRRFSF